MARKRAEVRLDPRLERAAEDLARTISPTVSDRMRRSMDRIERRARRFWPDRGNPLSPAATGKSKRAIFSFVRLTPQGIKGGIGVDVKYVFYIRSLAIKAVPGIAAGFKTLSAWQELIRKPFNTARKRFRIEARADLNDLADRYWK